jgi:hypothetical protein
MHFCFVAREHAGPDFRAFQASPAGVPSFWQNEIEFMNENNSATNHSPLYRDFDSFSLTVRSAGSARAS